MTATEANRQALARLAYLILRRHSREAGREFILLAADVRDLPARSDDLITQPIQVLHDAR